MTRSLILLAGLVASGVTLSSVPANADICVNSAFASCGVQTQPVIVDIFFGMQTTADGRQNLAQQAWEQDIGEPTRVINFDNAPIAGSTLLLSEFAGGDRGVVTTSVGNFFAFKTGGDVGLFPLFRDPDNIVIKEQGTGFTGVHNVTELTEPNVNLLGPAGNGFIELNFGEGIDLSNQAISNFGAVEAVGAFVLTTNPVTLSIFDAAGQQIFGFTRTPPNYSPFFMGIVLQRRDQPKQEIIATARFTFGGTATANALDGVVYTTVVDAPPPEAPVPEPATLLLLGSGLAGLGGFASWKRHRRK